MLESEFGELQHDAVLACAFADDLEACQALVGTSTNEQLQTMQGVNMTTYLSKLLRQENGQDIAEYAVMLAVILVLVIGTVRLIGGNANNAFSTVANELSQ